MWRASKVFLFAAQSVLQTGMGWGDSQYRCAAVAVETSQEFGDEAPLTSAITDGRPGQGACRLQRNRNRISQTSLLLYCCRLHARGRGRSPIFFSILYIERLSISSAALMATEVSSPIHYRHGEGTCNRTCSHRHKGQHGRQHVKDERCSSLGPLYQICDAFETGNIME